MGQPTLETFDVFLANEICARIFATENFGDVLFRDLCRDATRGKSQIFTAVERDRIVKFLTSTKVDAAAKEYFIRKITQLIDEYFVPESSVSSSPVTNLEPIND